MITLHRMKKIGMAAAVMLSSLPLQAAIWYVAPGGNDAEDCTDKSTPCSTLTGVMGKGAFAAGDSIYLKQGTYDNQGGAECQIYIPKAVEIYGGYNADYTERTVDASKTILTDSTTVSGPCRLFAINSGHEKYTVFDTVQFSDFNAPSSHTGTVLTYDIGAWIQFNNVIIKNNNVTNGGAIQATIAGDRIEITNSTLSGNTARSGTGGAVSMSGTFSRLLIRDSILDNNTAQTTGGAIHIQGGATAELTNVTLFGNTATGSAGGIYATGTNTVLSCTHCTIVGNTSPAATAKNVRALSNAALQFKNSVVLNEDASGTGPNIHISGGASFTDAGYNAFGLNSQSGASGVSLPIDASSLLNVEANASDLYESDIAYNGGTLKSLKLVKTSSLIDAIPNDASPLQAGTSPLTPFTSLAQAHSALAFYSHYKAGDYFFNLDGQTFKTRVTDDGWVLIASSNGSTPAAALTAHTVISLQSDRILQPAALAELDIDEIRITSPVSKLDNFDMRTNNATNIARLKNNQTLANNFDLSGLKTWWGTHEANMSNASCSDWGHGTVLSDNVIGHCGDATQGFHWQGARGYETVTWATPTPRDDMNLWVRSSAGHCDGNVNTDQRGLPRPDFVNPNDPNQYGDIHDCDIGAFEWNNGYKIDCYDEDGERPENSITSAEVTFCISNPAQVTPKAIMDNLGFASFWLLLLVGMPGVIRFSVRTCQQKTGV